MKYKVDKKKLEIGMHEFMKDKLNELEHKLEASFNVLSTCEECNVNYLKELIKDKIKSSKTDYVQLKSICNQYIDTKKYDNYFWHELIENAEGKIKNKEAQN